MQSKLYYIDGEHLRQRFEEQLEQFGVVMSEQEIEDYLRTLPIDEYMKEYTQAVYIRAANKMFSDILQNLKDSTNV